MEERFKYIHFKSEFFYNLLILNPLNYIKLIKIQITVNVSSKRRLGQDPTKYQGRLKKMSGFTRLRIPALSIAKNSCPHWHVATAKMDGNLSQKRNNGNYTFSWKKYKDNVPVQHRK